MLVLIIFTICQIISHWYRHFRDNAVELVASIGTKLEKLCGIALSRKVGP